MVWDEPKLVTPVPEKLKPIFNMVVGDFLFQSDPFFMIARKIFLAVYTVIMASALGLMVYYSVMFHQYGFLGDLLLAIGFGQLPVVVFVAYVLLRKFRTVSNGATLAMFASSFLLWTFMILGSAQAFDSRLVGLVIILFAQILETPGKLFVWPPLGIGLMSLSVYNDSYRDLTTDGRASAELPSRNTPGLERLLGVMITLDTSLICVLSVWAAVYKLTRPPRDNTLAPKDPTFPFTIAFTDIQSSTSLWSRLPEVMGPAVELHHELIREQIDRHGGYEVKTIGDAFMVAFQNPRDALLFAVGVQESLHNSNWNEHADEINQTYEELKMEAAATADDGHDKQVEEKQLDSAFNGLRVRIGVHFGLGDPKLDPVSWSYDYYGTVVNAASRVESIGHGGQVLISDSALRAVLGTEEASLGSSGSSESYRSDEQAGGLGNSSSGATTLPFQYASSTKNGKNQNLDLLHKNLGSVPLRGLSQPMPVHQVNAANMKTRTFPGLRIDKASQEDEEDDDDDDVLPGEEGDGAPSDDDMGEDERSAERLQGGTAFLSDHISHISSRGGEAVAGERESTTTTNFTITQATQKIVHSFLRRLQKQRDHEEMSSEEIVLLKERIQQQFDMFKLTLERIKPSTRLEWLKQLAHKWGIRKNKTEQHLVPLAATDQGKGNLNTLALTCDTHLMEVSCRVVLAAEKRRRNGIANHPAVNRRKSATLATVAKASGVNGGELLDGRQTLAGDPKEESHPPGLNLI